MIPAPVAAALVALLTALAPATVTHEPATSPTTVLEAPYGSRCGEWYSTALAAGWAPDEWPTVDRVMWCESRCNPAAYNRSGASGLMQVMPMHWRGRDPFDPATNLTMALEVHNRQGWRAWSCY